MRKDIGLIAWRETFAGQLPGDKSAAKPVESGSKPIIDELAFAASHAIRGACDDQRSAQIGLQTIELICGI